MRSSDVTYPADQEHDTTALHTVINGAAESVTVEKRCRHKDGHPMTVLVRANAVPGADGAPSFVISQYEPIGNGRMTDAHLAHLALHDPLTGLANRALLADRFAHELESLARGGVLAVLVADLDGLKPVNDCYGHAAGDQLLMAAAHEILATVSAGDTVARLGGDEFVVLSLVATSADATALRERITQNLDTNVDTAGARIPLHGSVGLTITSDPTASQDDLLHRADQDMYARKKKRASHRRTP